GGPSLPSDPKLAVVASSRSLAGRRFVVTGRRGRVVMRGRLKRAAGSAAPWGGAAIANLTRVRRSGSYRVKVGRLRSRPWVVSRGAYAPLLSRLTRIYKANSDGREPSSVFGPAHLRDALIAAGPFAGQRFDLTGGWRDAGDNLKFTQTTGLSVAALNYAARLAPARAAELRATSDVGVRWLLKTHPAPGLFVAQVGDQRDHEQSFRDPARDDALNGPGQGDRPAYPSTAAPAAGLAAAGLALAAERTGGGTRDQLLASARDWYAAGKANMGPVGAPGGFYDDRTGADNMAVGAAALWRATGDDSFQADAGTFLGASQFQSGVDSFEVAGLAAADLCGVLGAKPATSPAVRSVACNGLRQAAQAARERYRITAFGSPGAFSFGWVQDNGGSGAMATLAAKARLLRGGRTIGAGARDYLLGRNPWGQSFVVGPSRREAGAPHHSAYLKGNPRRLLNGAVVGGPASAQALKDSNMTVKRSRFSRFNSSAAIYEDRRDDYVTSEVGLAYSSYAILLVAALGP
ncbi:MAG TPA: glycoside hydrolase family 9 protein, partial [Thermoleophilaceae bacterium]|nr:glycoside hydrolase family 9 protein [Thermoleophilaceae bacterium]